MNTTQWDENAPMYVSGTFEELKSLCNKIGKSIDSIKPKQLDSNYMIVVKSRTQQKMIKNEH